MKKFVSTIWSFFTFLKNVLIPFKNSGNKQIFVFLLFLAISTMFWFLQSLNNKGFENISLPLKYKNIPADVIFAKEPPQEIEIQVRDKGINLINYSLGRVKPIEVDLSELYPQNGRVHIPREKLKSLIGEGLKPSTELVELYSDAFILLYANKQGVEKPIRLYSDIEISSNCIMNEIEVIPSNVIVYSDSSILSNIEYIETELLRLDNLTDTAKVKIKVKDIYGVKVEPQEVEVIVPVEELITKRMTLPIKPINFPRSITPIIFPIKASVDVMVPLSLYPETDNSKFKLVIDYRQYKYGQNKLPLTLKEMPNYVKRVSVYPDSVEYIIEKKESSVTVVDSLKN